MYRTLCPMAYSIDELG